MSGDPNLWPWSATATPRCLHVWSLGQGAVAPPINQEGWGAQSGRTDQRRREAVGAGIICPIALVEVGKRENDAPLGLRSEDDPAKVRCPSKAFARRNFDANTADGGRHCAGEI
jgi:hypothetical protein